MEKQDSGIAIEDHEVLDALDFVQFLMTCKADDILPAVLARRNRERDYESYLQEQKKGESIAEKYFRP